MTAALVFEALQAPVPHQMPTTRAPAPMQADGDMNYGDVVGI